MAEGERAADNVSGDLPEDTLIEAVEEMFAALDVEEASDAANRGNHALDVARWLG